jgi:hypothetical protein
LVQCAKAFDLHLIARNQVSWTESELHYFARVVWGLPSADEWRRRMRGVNWDAFAVFLQQRLACCNRFW